MYERGLYEYKGYLIRIIQDEWVDSPDDWGDVEVFLGWTENRRHCCGRRKWPKEDAKVYMEWGEGPWTTVYGGAIPPEEWDEDGPHDGWEFKEAHGLYEEWLSHQEEESDTTYSVFGVEIADYGGGNVALRFNDNWDDNDGYIFVRVPGGRTPMARLAAQAADTETTTPFERAKALMATWNQYLQGDVWCYDVGKIVGTDEDGDLVVEDADSCAGYYGFSDCKEAAESIVDSLVEQELKKTEVA